MPLDTFIMNLGKKDAHLTKELCKHIIHAFPEIMANLEQILEDEKANEAKDFTEKVFKNTATLAFKRYRENQPLYSDWISKPMIVEGRQRMETALESLVAKDYLPGFLDVHMRGQVAKAMKSMNSDRFTVGEIKAHLKQKLNLKRVTSQ